MTWRQFSAWLQYLEDEWNEPTRTDYYLMNIAHWVARAGMTKKANLQTEHFKIRFARKKGKGRETKAEKEARQKKAVANSKALALFYATAGGKVKPTVLHVPKPQDPQ